MASDVPLMNLEPLNKDQVWWKGLLLCRLGLRVLKHLRGKYQEAVGYMDPGPRVETWGYKYMRICFWVFIR